MQKRIYGTGANGPGHCFHQHVTFYLRSAGEGVPPACAYPGYTLQWSDLWSAIVSRHQIFDAAADHFAAYIESTGCFEHFGLTIERFPFKKETFVSDIRTVNGREGLLLAAVDTYYLPSFVEYLRVHGLTMCALVDVSAVPEMVDLWHWENSAMVQLEILIRSIESQGSKVWRLYLDRSRRIDAKEILEKALIAHSVLADDSGILFSDYEKRLREMVDEDLPLPDDEAERSILFHVPYRRLSNGNFRTIWLVRSAANRLMHARGTLEELLKWVEVNTSSPYITSVTKSANESFVKWKTLNVLCARYDINPSKGLMPIILQQLCEALEVDHRLGLACLHMLQTRQ